MTVPSNRTSVSCVLHDRLECLMEMQERQGLSCYSASRRFESVARSHDLFPDTRSCDCDRSLRDFPADGGPDYSPRPECSADDRFAEDVLEELRHRRTYDQTQRVD